MSGGASKLVLTANGYTGHRCARDPATLCLLGEQTGDQRQLIFTAFDPINGRGREVMKVATKPGFGYNWDLSPDGSQLAISFPAGENRIRLFALAQDPTYVNLLLLYGTGKGLVMFPAKATLLVTTYFDSGERLTSSNSGMAKPLERADAGLERTPRPRTDAKRRGGPAARPGRR